MQQSFSDLGVPTRITRALAERDIHTPFPIQEQVLRHALAGRDILAKAPTGSGKTLGFAIPIVERLEASERGPLALVLVPTRELASQVAGEIEAIAPQGISVATVYGGVPVHAQAKRARRAHVLVATPGRMNDLLERKAVALDGVRILILDEADRMLDMGFKPQVDRIVRRLPRERQTMFFSATLDASVGELARMYTTDPVRCEAAPLDTEEGGEVEHRFVSVKADDKVETLAELLRGDRGLALVFVRTRRGADRLVKKLAFHQVDAVALHGDLSQGQRERALQAIRERAGDDARRDGRRCARARSRRHHARHQLRPAGGALRLPPSRRPNRSRGAQRRGRHLRPPRAAGGRQPCRSPGRPHRAVRVGRHEDRAAAARVLLAARAVEVGRARAAPEDLAHSSELLVDPGLGLGLVDASRDADLAREQLLRLQVKGALARRELRR